MTQPPNDPTPDLPEDLPTSALTPTPEDLPEPPSGSFPEPTPENGSAAAPEPAFPPPPPAPEAFPPASAAPSAPIFPPPPPASTGAPYTPPAYGANAFPPPPAAGASAFPVSGLKPHRATMDIVLGVLGLLCCGFLAFPAYFMSRNDIAEMDAGRMDPTGRGTTNIAKILGIIGMVWFVLNILFTVFFFSRR